jgi:acetamidase/formamidase
LLSVQTFRRQLTKSHCVGAAWPEFVGSVQLGESFIIETECDDPNGPVAIDGVNAGDAIAVHIERIEMEGPFFAPNGGPFVEGMGEPVPLVLRAGWFNWPGGYRLKARPSVGNIAVLPEAIKPVRDAIREYNMDGRTWPNPKGWRRVVREPRGKHCHQDCWALGEGAVLHIKAQVHAGGLCLDDVHGYISEGELSFSAIEVRARVQLRVERSVGWLVDWPIIETADEILVFSSFTSTYASGARLKYVDVVREAYRSLRNVVAARTGGSIEDANSICATAADIKNCALYGLGDGYIPADAERTPYDIAVVARLPKTAFELAASRRRS